MEATKAEDEQVAGIAPAGDHEHITGNLKGAEDDTATNQNRVDLELLTDEVDEAEDIHLQIVGVFLLLIDFDSGS